VVQLPAGVRDLYLLQKRPDRPWGWGLLRLLLMNI